MKRIVKSPNRQAFVQRTRAFKLKSQPSMIRIVFVPPPQASGSASEKGSKVLSREHTNRGFP